MTAPEKMVIDIIVAIANVLNPTLAPKTGASVPKAPLAIPISRIEMKETGEFR